MSKRERENGLETQVASDNLSVKTSPEQVRSKGSDDRGDSILDVRGTLKAEI